MASFFQTIAQVAAVGAGAALFPATGPGGALTIGALLGRTALSLGVGLAVGAADARKARRQIEQNKKQRDLTITLPTAPRRRIYGVDRVPGVLRYWTTHGPENRFLSLVYVFADHPCQAFYDIQFDDRSLGDLDANGYVQAGSPWYKSRLVATSQNLAAVSGSITLPSASAGMPSVSIAGSSFPGYVPQVGTNDSGFVDLTPGVHFTHSVGGTVITLVGVLTGASIDAGSVVVNYTIQSGRPLARVRRFLGAVPQTADATLITDSGGEWTASCRLDNQTYAIVTLEWDESVAANGVPVVHAVLAGAKVYDPRSGLTAWSDNWALCIRDYLKHTSGCADSEIDDATVIESANKSAELVTVDDGTVGRYTINGSIESTTDPIDALTDMALAGGGTVSWSAGKFRVLAGMYRTPVSITLNDSHLAGPIKYQGEVSREDRFNTVIGAFRDARSVGGAVPYTRTDYSAYKSTAYVAEDNGATIERRIDFDFITDYRVAHRVAKQILRRARQGARLTATWSLRALPLQVGDVVTVTLNRYGISAKPFEVVSTQHNYPDTVTTVLQETDATCYDWDYTEVAFLDPAPNTLLPSPTDVAMPVLSVLCTADEPATIKTLTDGSQIPYARVSWPARTNAAEYVEIRWKRSFETMYRTAPASRPGETFVDIEGISGGDTLQIVGQAINGIGARSDQWIIGEYKVDSRLPRYTGALPPLSANLLKNATLDVNTALWTPFVVGIGSQLVAFERHPDPQGYAIAGSPSSAVLGIASPLTGNGLAAGVVSEPVAITDPAAQVVVFAWFVAYGTDIVVGIRWLDTAGAQIGPTAYGNTVAGTLTNPAATFNRADAYLRSGLVTNPPAGAAAYRVEIIASGNWAAVTNKFVSVFQPFAGEMPQGAAEFPPWAPGGSNIVDTPTLADNAATLVLSEPVTSPRTIRADGLPDPTGLPSITIPADLDVADGATMRVHVSLGVRTVGGASAGSHQDIGMLFGLEDSSDGLYYPGAVLFDAHLSSSRSMVGVALSGSTSYSWTFRHRAGVSRRFAIGVGFFVPVGGVDNSLWTTTLLAGSSLTVEFLKK